MKGWLIVNRFLNNGKFSELYDWLIKAAKKAGHKLSLMTNADITVRADTGEILYPFGCSVPDFVIFWDKDIRLARALEAEGLKLYNCADAIEACDDKSLTCKRLSGIVRMPATFNVPFTYEGPGYCNTDFLTRIEQEINYPYVLKECFGSFGDQVHLIHSRKQCEEALRSINGRPCIVQEYIPSPYVPGTDIIIRPTNDPFTDGKTDKHFTAGQDIRIIVVGDKIIASMLRYNDHDFRANVALGGHTAAYTPNERETDMALKACRALKLDYAGVDLLRDAGGEPVLCEVNSNAHFRGIYECTGINAADAVIAHITESCGR